MFSLWILGEIGGAGQKTFNVLLDGSPAGQIGGMECDLQIDVGRTISSCMMESGKHHFWCGNQSLLLAHLFHPVHSRRFSPNTLRVAPLWSNRMALGLLVHLPLDVFHRIAPSSEIF